MTEIFLMLALVFLGIAACSAFFVQDWPNKNTAWFLIITFFFALAGMFQANSLQATNPIDFSTVKHIKIDKPITDSGIELMFIQYGDTLWIYKNNSTNSTITKVEGN